jgi:hypothetical protein
MINFQGLYFIKNYRKQSLPQTSSFLHHPFQPACIFATSGYEEGLTAAALDFFGEFADDFGSV